MEKIIGTSFVNFSQQVKKEIAAKEIRKDCCKTAAAYGVACFAKSFNSSGLVFVSEQSYIANHVKTIFSLCSIDGQVHCKGKLFEYRIEEVYAVEKMLALFGHSGTEHSLRILQDNFICESCAAHFAASAFLCSGTITAPNKSYNLEFVAPKLNVLKDFAQLLEGQGFLPKISNRKGVNVLYFKSSGQIEDMLTYMGAQKSSMEIMNLKIYKDVRNTANRITNCETANIDKTVRASHKIVKDIIFLRETGAMQALPESVQQAAELRCRYPDVSLAELTEMSDRSLTKSGLAHRLRKISETAKKLKENI